MAIKVKVTKPNGIILDYHRIAMIKIDVNQQISILVESYLSENGRIYEKQYASGLIEGEPNFQYYHSEYLHISYDETLPMLQGNIIKNAYEWLKSKPEYAGAIDI